MKRALVLGSLLALAGSACGDDDDGSLGGVAAEENLGDLSQEQLRDVCVAATARVQELGGDDARRGSCLLGAGISASFAGTFGTPAADLEQICGAEFEECLSQPLETSEPQECNLAPPMPTCTATVGDYRRCIGYIVDAFKLIASYSCEEVVNEEVPQMSDGGLGSDVSDCNDLLEPCLNTVGEGDPNDGTSSDFIDAGTG